MKMSCSPKLGYSYTRSFGAPQSKRMERDKINAAKSIVKLAMHGDSFSCEKLKTMIDTWKTQLSSYAILEILASFYEALPPRSKMSPKLITLIDDETKLCYHDIFLSTNGKASAPPAHMLVHRPEETSHGGEDEEGSGNHTHNKCTA